MITPTTKPDGSISLDVDNDALKRIDIENILTIDSFTRRTEGKDTIIEIEFASGGKFKMRYTPEGDITEFRGFHIGMRGSDDHVIALRDFDPSLDQEQASNKAR